MTKVEEFTTIDDLRMQAEALVNSIKMLAQYRYPLAVRRGVALVGEEVVDMAIQSESYQLKGSGKTYFFDIESTKDGEDKYLRITESRKSKDGKWVRNSIFVFGKDVKSFVDKLHEVTKSL